LIKGSFSTYGIKVIVDPVERSGALQQLMCARVVNTKLSHIVSICPQTKLEGGWAAAIALS